MEVEVGGLFINPMSARREGIARQRLEKLQRIRHRGIEPYPHRYHRTYTTQEAIALLKQQEKIPSVQLAGRIVASRLMGGATFMDLRDGSGKLQIYFRRDELGEEKYELLQDFDIGDFIGVSGEPFTTHSGEPTLRVSDFVMLAKSLQPLPEKWHGLADVEKRYRQRYLDLIANQEVKDIFLVRSRLIVAIRRFLNSRGFVEMETPVLLPVASGAAARPFVTHHYALSQKLYLRIATELYLKRLVAGGFEKVYEIGRIFRNEGISTKHNPEFTMLESYEAYSDYNDVMKMVEEMISYLAKDIWGTTKLNFGGTTLDFSPPWQCLSLRQAIYERCGIDFEQYPEVEQLRAKMYQIGMDAGPSKSRGKLIDELISTCVEPHFIQPTFVLDYPIELSPLAKRKPDNPHLVERFEAFAGGMEIANAFTELNDPIEQRQRFAEQLSEREGEDEEAQMPDEDFLLALEYGMPPTGGLGLGIDRLVMLFTNHSSIREVILFPQMRAK
jgi:lysyl-tRNA synthetase class 2